MMHTSRSMPILLPRGLAAADRLVGAGSASKRTLTAVVPNSAGARRFGAADTSVPQRRSFPLRARTGERRREILTVRTMVMVSQHKADDPAAGLGDQISAEGPIAAAEAAAAPAPVEEQLSITDSCWKRIRQLAQRRNLSLQDVYLRVYVDAGGCSGFSYKFEIDEAPVEEGEDVVFRHPNIPDLRVVVDAASLDLIRGSSIDYVEEMIKSSFEVRDNPQSESACGCGSSFALKNFAANPALD